MQLLLRSIAFRDVFLICLGEQNRDLLIMEPCYHHATTHRIQINPHMELRPGSNKRVMENIVSIVKPTFEDFKQEGIEKIKNKNKYCVDILYSHPPP